LFFVTRSREEGDVGMRQRTILLLTTAVAALLAAAGAAFAQQSATPDPSGGSADNVIDGQYIVVLKGGVSDPRDVARDHARKYGAEVLYTYDAALNGYAARVPAQKLDEVRNDPNVSFVSADRRVHAFVQTLPKGVDRIEGDLSSTKSNDGSGSLNNPVVAIIDTGIDIDHPDLNVVGGKNCQSGTSYDDGNGHGTHVAGTVAAKDDGNGVVGMAPGAPLYAVRVLNNNGSGSWSAITCGIDWVTANAGSLNIKVANMSLGGSGSDGSCNSDALHLAICNSVNKGVTYVVAAGNSKKNFSGFVPAAYNEVLTVTAVADFNGKPGGGAAATCRSDVDDTPADFSNFTKVGSNDEGHTIAAPGVCIRSTWKGGGYSTISGTSMASPHVAGTTALCIASGQCSGLTTPSQIISKLRTDTAAEPASYGFAKDAHQVTAAGSRYYGYLVYAGGY
jgi:subtilisin